MQNIEINYSGRTLRSASSPLLSPAVDQRGFQTTTAMNGCSEWHCKKRTWNYVSHAPAEVNKNDLCQAPASASFWLLVCSHDLIRSGGGDCQEALRKLPLISRAASWFDHSMCAPFDSTFYYCHKAWNWEITEGRRIMCHFRSDKTIKQFKRGPRVTYRGYGKDGERQINFPQILRLRSWWISLMGSRCQWCMATIRRTSKWRSSSSSGRLDGYVTKQTRKEKGRACRL